MGSQATAQGTRSDLQKAVEHLRLAKAASENDRTPQQEYVTIHLERVDILLGGSLDRGSFQLALNAFELDMRQKLELKLRAFDRDFQFYRSPKTEAEELAGVAVTLAERFIFLGEEQLSLGEFRSIVDVAQSGTHGYLNATIASTPDQLRLFKELGVLKGSGKKGSKRYEAGSKIEELRQEMERSKTE